MFSSFHENFYNSYYSIERNFLFLFRSFYRVIIYGFFWRYFFLGKFAKNMKIWRGFISFTKSKCYNKILGMQRQFLYKAWLKLRQLQDLILTQKLEALVFSNKIIILWLDELKFWFLAKDIRKVIVK